MLPSKNKVLVTLSIILIGLAAKYVLFDYPISSGKRTGNLTRISLRGKILKTWEGTLNEGFGEKLTTYFSISSSDLANQLYQHEGRKVVIFYEHYFLGWPRETNYNVVRWEPAPDEEMLEQGSSSAQSISSKILSKTLFCSLLGTLRTNEELYLQVKKQVETTNPYLFKQIEECNKN